MRGGGAALFPALLIGGFVAGVFTGALLAAKWPVWRKPAVLALVALNLLAGALLDASGHGVASLLPLAMAMGALNNTFQRDGEVAVGLTYMTGALVRAGQGLALAALGRGGKGWLGHLALWAGLACGAVLGAWVTLSIGHSEWIACGGAFLRAVAAWMIVRLER